MLQGGMSVLEGLRKIDGSKNCYQSPEGKVYSLKEMKPIVKGNKKYYRLTDENGNKFYYSIKVTKNVTQIANAEVVTKNVTEKSSIKKVTENVTAPKKQFTEEEIRNMVF